MKRRVFYSFHHKEDHWRAAQVRNIGVLEGNKPVSDNDWEEVKKGGDAAIKRWIDDQMNNRSCVVVLVGEYTANRKWINYEIKKGWEDKKGVVGVRIHGLKNQDGETSKKGANPFDYIWLGNSKLSSIVKCHDPEGNTSEEKYSWIEKNLSKVVEKAIQIRENQ